MNEWENLTAWLKEQANRIVFGEITLKIILHAGGITQIDRLILERERLKSDLGQFHPVLKDQARSEKIPNIE